MLCNVSSHEEPSSIVRATQAHSGRVRASSIGLVQLHLTEDFKEWSLILWHQGHEIAIGHLSCNLSGRTRHASGMHWAESCIDRYFTTTSVPVDDSNSFDLTMRRTCLDS